MSYWKIAKIYESEFTTVEAGWPSTNIESESLCLYFKETGIEAAGYTLFTPDELKHIVERAEAVIKRKKENERSTPDETNKHLSG